MFQLYSVFSVCDHCLVSIALYEELSLLDNRADNYIFNIQNRLIEQTFEPDGVACRLFCAFDDKIDTLLTVCCAFILIPF